MHLLVLIPAPIFVLTLPEKDRNPNLQAPGNHRDQEYEKSSGDAGA
ncbi:hypothetical protein HMPREF9374_1928 [Desmospora sp. 8437]|nr:hypothetical protein HMPREF9374_1928 [Desmospora sp. 8437]